MKPKKKKRKVGVARENGLEPNTPPNKYTDNSLINCNFKSDETANEYKTELKNRPNQEWKRYKENEHQLSDFISRNIYLYAIKCKSKPAEQKHTHTH